MLCKSKSFEEKQTKITMYLTVSHLYYGMSFLIIRTDMYSIHCMLPRSLITGELSIICGQLELEKKNIRMLLQGQDYFKLVKVLTSIFHFPPNVPHFL